MATLIQQAYLLGAVSESAANSGAGEGPIGTGDVLISEGKIEAIGPVIDDLPADTEVIDGKGQFLGPGLIDLYSQSGEPGHESRETYASIQRAAAAGGFTRVGLLPNTQPAVDSPSAIAQVLTSQQSADQTATQTAEPTAHQASAPKAQSHTAKLIPWAAITLGTEGQQLTELGELTKAGALGFTDGKPIADPVLLRRLLEYAQPLKKPIALWPCDRKLASGGIVREGADALRLGLKGVSAIAETSLLATLIECVASIGTPIHLMRISTARSVALIRQAKADGLSITASVPWHHLIFDTQDLEHYDPNLRHDPPLGTPSDRAALIAGVADGVIDAIAIDHSPYTYEENTVAFESAPPGAIGLELALPVLWQTFVTSGQWSPAQLWHALSQGPAHCLGQAAFSLQPGSPAALTLFNPQTVWQATPETLYSLASNTPWANQPIQGKVTQIWRPL